MTENLKNILINKLGFTSQEAEVYLFLLKKTSTVTEIVDKTGIPRTTVYDILKSWTKIFIYATIQMSLRFYF